MKRANILIRTIVVAALMATPTVHAADPVYTGWFSSVAADGYDVVAYFTRGEAVEGSNEHTHEWGGAEWHFANEDHLERFHADPEKYAPAYGGYCAYAVAEGTTEAGDPRAWTIHEGRLFFNYDDGVQERWDEDREAYIAAADRNWPDLVD